MITWVDNLMPSPANRKELSNIDSSNHSLVERVAELEARLQQVEGTGGNQIEKTSSPIDST
jgi:hypothetical protein